MAYVGIPIAILTMFVAQRIERRLGPAAAGWFAALPIAFAVAAATIAATSSANDASEVALSAAGHIGPMSAYAVAFVWGTTRWGAVRGFCGAVVVYAFASIAIIPLSGVVRICVGIVALVLATAYMRRLPRAVRVGEPASKAQQLLSLSSAGLVVAVITIANAFAGPALAGTLGAFPTMSTTVALFLAHRVGVRNANSVMGGLVRSLPVYLAYCLSFAYLVTHLALTWSVVLATAVALLAAMATWRRVERRDISDNGVLYSEP